MSRRPKLLGIETDVWALMTPEGQIRAGDYKPSIYWTREIAKREQQNFRDGSVVAVRIVVVENEDERR